HFGFSPSLSETASASSTPQPTGLPSASLYSLGGYSASVPMRSSPESLTSAGSSATAASSTVTSEVPPPSAGLSVSVAPSVLVQPVRVSSAAAAKAGSA